MACLEMYNQNNNEHNKHLGGAPPLISPRISFSNDFVLDSSSSSSSSVSHPHFRSYRDAPVSSDFEFSVSNYSMMSADELFSQGKLLPLKENCTSSTHPFQRTTTTTTTTLRDELMNGDDNDADFSLRPPKSSTRWKGFLGLKKSHIGSRKIERGEGSDLKRSSFLHEDGHSGKPSQDMMMNDGGSGSKMNQDQFRF
ncbi:OLC1v1010139C1 [Oldenlandia corymbosa var. corymbosa]|uniref:OLC1v1010139C1 n=1 Tax=Oldenlandia corymbosa var. corymbosa TaxID=529605 RepID=A0AAV1DQM3_OLDCO|nr:OLC1v1010139C1 [Oldenlandia corymbosa var. corymbosa]